MVTTNMDRRYGTKWFTYYTKVRPWFALFSMILSVVYFAMYTDEYLSKWYLILYLLLTVLHAILSLFVFAKSFEDYNVFVKFVDWVLVFEAYSLIFQVCVNQYIQYGDALLCVISALISYLVSYFWYKWNIYYFEKRVM